MSDPAPKVVFMQVNESDIDDPSKPLNFGDFDKALPCKSPLQLFAKHPAHLNSGSYQFPRPQPGSTGLQSNSSGSGSSIYSLPSDD